MKLHEEQSTFQGNSEHLDVLLNALKNDDIRLWNDWKLDNLMEVPNLRGVNLVGARMIGIDLIGADLAGSNLSKADLSSADLSGVELSGSILVETRLVHATIYGGGLEETDLRYANLDGAVLNNTIMSGVNLTGANIKGISNTGWNIKNIKCDYIFRGSDHKDREPREGEYEQDEFEKLYQYTSKIEHIFIDEFTNIDILIMDKVVQEINVQNPEYKVKLDCFHVRGKPRAEFIIKNLKDSEKVLAEIENRYEKQKIEFVHKLELANIKIETYREILSMSIREPSILIESMELNENKNTWVKSKLVMEQCGSNLEKELSELRRALKKESKTLIQDQVIGEIADAEHSVNVGDGGKALKHLKNAGKWALDVSTNIGTKIATEAIKKSMGL